jgi:Short C-terminal domain
MVRHFIPDGWIMAMRVLLAIILTSVITVGCVQTRTITRPVFDNHYTIVRLEAWLDRSKKPIPMGYGQPVEISGADMARILESIRVVQPPGLLSRMILKNRDEPEPAFTESESAEFGKLLSEAFGIAKPDERVVFFFHHQRTIYKGTTTSGIAFIKNQRLNFILGRYYMGNEPGYPDIPVGGNPFPSSNQQDFYLVPGPFETMDPGDTAPGGDEAVYPKRWLQIDYASLLNPPPETAAPAEPGQIRPAPAPPPSTLEDKLKILSKLKEDGLITEEEFEEKKKELLKAF